ncbi:dihydrodipicolinate synthase family protein [Gracilibacillus suaedae]|uniref:dihydrodipicolinate synthase family protein n=1 Tax=Gracilibacillus suaedae TaxID=2820273 RepID=UPI001ABDD161|nr:dihydrodipicolinate synthase family protein [Gracilibacillus suaedae]
MKKLFGVTTAMVTPMNEDGTVNLEETEKLTNFLIEKGVDCLYPLGTTGEMFKLTLNERKQIAETVINTAKKRVNVFIHAGAMHTSDTLDLAMHAHKAGADGVGVVTPAFFTVSDLEIENYYATIAKQLPGDFPIYLYSIPQLSGNKLSIEVVTRLAEQFPNIVGIKYSYPDFITLKDYTKVRSGEFSVLTGADKLFLPALAMGCDGVVSGVSGVFPEPFVKLYQHYQHNQIEKTREIQHVADEIIHILRGGANMSYFKKALELRGIQAGSVKAPHMDIISNDISALETAINQWKAEYLKL